MRDGAVGLATGAPFSAGAEKVGDFGAGEAGPVDVPEAGAGPRDVDPVGVDVV